MAGMNNQTHGTTVIDDVVLSKIAGIAAREVSGVWALGGQAARVVGALRDSVGATTNIQQGVTVTSVDGRATVDVSIVAEYGVAIHELAEAIRTNITTAIERMTGTDVAAVNVTVYDVHLDQDTEAQVATVPGEVQPTPAEK